MPPSFVLVIAVTAFLAGAAIAVFIMLVAGIHKASRARRMSGDRITPLDAVTRSTLGVRNWPDGPALDDSDRS
jgi:hypothetical protein